MNLRRGGGKFLFHEDCKIQIKAEELLHGKTAHQSAKPCWKKKMGLFFHLFRSVLQADKFPINIYLFNADIPSG